MVTDALTPPLRLALAYCDPKNRQFFGLLLQFDRRLFDIIFQAREPLVAQMKLAWWRDSLRKPAEQRPKGEPMLADMLAVETAHPDAAIADTMLLLVDAWDILLSHEIWDSNIIQKHIAARAEGLFGGYAKIADAQYYDAALKMGAHMADMQIHYNFTDGNFADGLNDPGHSYEKPQERLPRQLRSLSILAWAAYLECVDHKAGQRAGYRAAVRLFWHSMTGR